MASIKENAQEYEPKQIKNIAELDKVSVDWDVKEDLEVEFPFKFIELDGHRYKVPITVLANLKDILVENPEIKFFKVKKSGEGIKTNYTVIPIS